MFYHINRGNKSQKLLKLCVVYNIYNFFYIGIGGFCGCHFFTKTMDSRLTEIVVFNKVVDNQFK